MVNHHSQVSTWGASRGQAIRKLELRGMAEAPEHQRHSPEGDWAVRSDNLQLPSGV